MAAPEGFEVALQRKKRATPPLLDGTDEADRDASGKTSGGLRLLDVKTLGGSNGGTGNRRFHQPRDGSQDAKKRRDETQNGVLGHSSTEVDGEFVANLDEVVKPIKNPTTHSAEGCAWMNNRGSLSMRLAFPSKPPRIIPSEWTTNTNERARRASSCSPNLWPDTAKPQRVPAEQRSVELSKSLICSTADIPRVRQSLWLR